MASICVADDIAPPARLRIKGGLAPADFNEQESLSKLRALELFPDLEKEDSPLHKRVDEEMARMQVEQPQTFDRPDWPVAVARYCAGCLTIQPKSFADILLKSPDKAILQWDKDPHFSDLVIRSAKYRVGDVDVNVTRNLQAKVEKGTLTVKCGDALLPDPADDAGVTREDGETGEEFWKRQAAAMKASTIKNPKAARSLKVVYERCGEIHTVTVEEGKWMQIDLPPMAEESEAAQNSTAPKPASVFLLPTDLAK